MHQRLGGPPRGGSAGPADEWSLDTSRFAPVGGDTPLGLPLARGAGVVLLVLVDSRYIITPLLFYVAYRRNREL